MCKSVKLSGQLLHAFCPSATHAAGYIKAVSMLLTKTLTRTAALNYALNEALANILEKKETDAPSYVDKPLTPKQ
eukprot:3490340-Amphidinium_carterae.2